MSDFGESIRKLQTMAGTSQEELSTVSDAILAIASGTNMRAIKFRVWDGEKRKMFPVRELFWRDDPYEMIGNYWDFEDEHDQYGKAIYFPHTDRHGQKCNTYI
jgi:hypothetical protein